MGFLNVFDLGFVIYMISSCPFLLCNNPTEREKDRKDRVEADRDRQTDIIGIASTNSVEFSGIRPRMYIEDIL